MMGKKGTLALKVVLGLLVILTLSLGAFLATAFVDSRTSSPETVSDTQAQMISDVEARLIAEQTVAGTLMDSELVEIDGVSRYVVEIQQDDTEFEVHVDPNSGAVLKVERESDVGREELAVVEVSVTEEEAIAIAQKRVLGTFSEVEVEKVDGTYVYAVEFEDDTREHEVLVDVNTGAVLRVESEKYADDDAEDDSGLDDDDENEVKVSSSGSKITLEQAKEIAIAEVDGVVTDTDTDQIGRREAWEIELDVKGDEVDVLVDMETGEVLTVEWD